MIKRVKKEIKYNGKKVKWKIMRLFHIGHLKIIRIPVSVRYVISIVFIGSGVILLTTPIPGVLFIFMGVGIISPAIQYKYIGKYFKPRTIRRLEKIYSLDIKKILIKQKPALH